MVVDDIFRNRLEAIQINIVGLTAEDQLLVILGILHSRLHGGDLGMSRLDRRNDILLLVGIVGACILLVKLEQVGDQDPFGIVGSARIVIHVIVNELHRGFQRCPVLTDIRRFITYDILIKCREILTVGSLEILSIVAKPRQHLRRINDTRQLCRLALVKRVGLQS